MANEVVNWRPNPKQAEFLMISDDIFEVLFGGSVGPGKSEVITLFPLLREFYKIPKFKGLIMRRTFPELQSEIILRAHQYYPHTGAVYSADQKTYNWPQYHSQVRFGHMEYEASKHKYDSAEYQFFGPDELTSFEESMYKHIAFQRMRSVVGLPPLVRAASNPGNIGHSWVRDRFIRPSREGRKVLVSKSGQKRLFLPAFLTDNIDLMESDPGYAKRLEMLPEAEKRAKLYGDWWTFTGQVFGDFRLEPMAGEPDWATHVYNPATVEIPYQWPRLIATDVGLAAMNYTLWAAIDPAGDVWIYREFDSENERLEQWSRTIGRLSHGQSVHRWILDHTLFEGEGEKIVSRVKAASGLSCPVTKAVKGRGSRYLGLVRLQEYLYWNAEKNRKPRLHISSQCQKLLETIPLCQYKEDKVKGQVNDVAEFQGDDPYDCIRYLLDICHAHHEGIITDINEIHEKADLENLAKAQEWTSYFIRKASQRRNPRNIITRRSRRYVSRAG